MFDLVMLLFFFLLGLLVGSFLNVVVLRFGFLESSAARSHCPHCGVQIRWYDLVPVFSFVLLGGKCRACGSILTVQYPLVELAAGALFALVYATAMPVVSFVSLIEFVGLLVFFSSLLAIVVYDMRHTLVPLPFVAMLTFAAIAVRSAESLSFMNASPLFDALYGALAIGGFFALITFLSGGRGMGSGDAYVASSIGILLGLLKGFEAAVIGVWSGTVFYAVLLIFSRTSLLPSKLRVTMRSELPFAPWLFIGTSAVLFAKLSPLTAVETLLGFVW